MKTGDKVGNHIMPLLLDILRNAANTPEYHRFRARAMECAGPIGLLAMSYQLTVRHPYRLLSAQRSATAVGRKVFERIQGFRWTSYPNTKARF
jgi:hypothetical protein